MHGVEEDLEHCRRELFRLLNENAALRYAASSFGDLAERLNFIVRRYRHSAPESPGEAQSVREELGISHLHRSDVASLDSDEGA
jgi:hypothetical protein